jgi:hypothetical protein
MVAVSVAMMSDVVVIRLTEAGGGNGDLGDDSMT